LREFGKKISLISNFMKIRPVATESFHVEGQTDGQVNRQTDREEHMMKLIVTSSNFANAPKKVLSCL
jgi:hypothetical protein